MSWPGKTELVYDLPESHLHGCWVLVEGQVNIDDFCNARPGRAIRVKSQDALRFIPAQLPDDYSRLAGMISDAA